MSPQSLNCSWTRQSWNGSFYLNESLTATQPQVRANPDVSGIGVLIGFIGSGYMCWAILLFYYLMEYNPHQAGFSGHINPIDMWILNWIRKLTGAHSDKWGSGLEKSVLMLSDTQIVTGIAILVSGYLQLDSDFSSYHWQVTIWLAWFSSATHLGTLTVLRNYLREYPAIRAQRLFLMSIIVIMLIVSLVPTGSPIWGHFPGEKAGCYFQFLGESWKASGPGQQRNDAFLAMTTVAIIMTGFLTRIIKLFPRVSTYARTNLRVKPGRQVKQGLDTLLRVAGSVGPGGAHWTIPIFYNPFLALFLIARATCDLIESMLWEVLWLFYALLWVSFRIFSLRGSISGLDSEENTWGFGQLVSILLLAMPVLSMIEMCYEARKSNGKAPVDSTQPITSVEESSFDLEAQPQTSFSLSLASEAGTGTLTTESGPGIGHVTTSVHGQTLYQTEIPPFSHNFYRYPWFCGLVLLLLTSTAANATIILDWAISGSGMSYFMGGGIPTLWLLIAWFQVPTIFTYTLLFLPTTRSSVSAAEWLVLRLCYGKSIKVQKIMSTTVYVVFLLLSHLATLMSFYMVSRGVVV